MHATGVYFGTPLVELLVVRSTNPKLHVKKNHSLPFVRLGRMPQP